MVPIRIWKTFFRENKMSNGKYWFKLLISIKRFRIMKVFILSLLILFALSTARPAEEYNTGTNLEAVISNFEKLMNDKDLKAFHKKYQAEQKLKAYNKEHHIITEADKEESRYKTERFFIAAGIVISLLSIIGHITRKETARVKTKAKRPIKIEISIAETTHEKTGDKTHE